MIFGITGDLARKKLLPAIFRLASSGKINADNLRIIGVTRQAITAEDFLSPLTHARRYKRQTVREIVEMLELYQMDITLSAHYSQLKSHIKALERSLGWRSQKLIYLSMPPQIFGPVIDLLGESGLNRFPSRRNTRLLVEKPFGFDTTSAAELIERTTRQFTEQQIYRIDHYLAKETVQNILTFRLHNPLFRAIWNRRSIESITITASEEIGIEGRSVFYEQTGALRDLIQSHLMQLMALIAMEEPSRLSASRIRAEKLKLLHAVQPASSNFAIRGQYGGYRDDVGNPVSAKETFAAIKLFIDTPRWKGVPVILRTGKALDKKSTTITLTFKNRLLTGRPKNRLVLRLQPDEGIRLDVLAKVPGFDNKIKRVGLDFGYEQSFRMRQPEAYERILYDAIIGEQTLFASGDEIMAAWRILQPVIEAWDRNTDDLIMYPRGRSAAQLSRKLTIKKATL